MTLAQKSRGTSSTTVTIPLRIQRQTAQNLDQLTKALHARSRNQVIRDAIEEYTSKMMNTNIVELREVSVDEAAKLIDEFISKNPGKHYVSELSEELGIELATAFKATQKLIGSGKVRRRK